MFGYVVGGIAFGVLATVVAYEVGSKSPDSESSSHLEGDGFGPGPDTFSFQSVEKTRIEALSGTATDEPDFSDSKEINPPKNGVSSRAFPDGNDSCSESSGTLDLSGDWMGLVEDCVRLIDELDRQAFAEETQPQALAAHVIDRLREVLERSGVECISNETIFDRNRHQPDRIMPFTVCKHRISRTVSPGFAVGRQILRRARVQLDS